MAVAESILDLLPFVRRFARALTGNLQHGDLLVKLTVRALVSTPSHHTMPSEVRLHVYKTFLETCDSEAGLQLFETLRGEATFEGPERVLGQIPLKARQAFLLVTMEGYSAQAAATIMGVSVSALLRLLAAAQDVIAVETSTDVLIIEDEVLIAHDLQQIVESLGHKVIARVKSREDVPSALNGRVPGLILADICLVDDGSGIDAVNDILKSNSVPVVFITAYPERLVTGPRPEFAFLLSKPFTAADVRAIISQVLLFQMKARFVSDPDDVAATPVVSGSARLKRVIQAR